MKVILEVGPRNEELIEKVREAKKNDQDIFWVIGEPSSELYDAMYYACECGDIMLEDQARYLQWLLIEEEHSYYEDRMMMDRNHNDSLDNLKIQLEKCECGAWKLWGVHHQEGNEHPITFAIAKHEDGWEYHYVNKATHQSEDGVYDAPEATAFEALCNLLEGFGFFLTYTGEKLDYETVVAEYESKIK